MSVIVKKKIIRACVKFWMATEIQLFESPSLIPLDFYLCGWMKGQVYRRKVDTQDELLTRIFEAAARIK